jgi:hypothetical protein
MCAESPLPTRESPARHRALLSFTVRIIAAVALLGLLVREFGGSDALQADLWSLPLFALLAALGLNAADRVLMAWKWVLLLRVRDQKLGVLDATRIYCASMVWGVFLPATMGSDAVRAISTVRHGLPAADVLASIVIERALGLVASLVVGLLGLLAVSLLGELPRALAPIGWFGAVALAGGALVLAISFSERFDRWVYEGVLARWARARPVERLREVHATYRSFGSHPRALWRFFALSLVEQLGPFLPIWVLSRALGLEVSPLYLAGAVTLAFLIARVPLSLGGIGVMEGALVLLLSLEGVPGPQAVALAVSARVVEVVSWLPWWLWFVLRSGSLRRPTPERR